MVHRHDVAVVIDSSSSCLPPDRLKESNITIIPDGLIIGDRVLWDGADVTSEEFYGILRSAEPPITTVAPNRQRYLESFAEASQRNRHILVLTLSSSLIALSAARWAAVMHANAAADAQDLCQLAFHTGPVHGAIAV